MEPVFNEFGKPSQAVEDAAYHVGEAARKFLFQMTQDGYNGADLRAVGMVFMQEVDLQVSHAVLDKACRMRQFAKENADPNLDEAEINFSKTGNKIQAIKHYRDRTTFGLKESKDAIEAWMLTNLGTKNPAYQPAPEPVHDDDYNRFSPVDFPPDTLP